MTTFAQQLSEYACSLQPRDLPAAVVHKAKGLVIDTIGCAIGAYASEPAKIARDVASACGSGTSRATIIGSGQAASPDLAAFVNGVMIRYLDYNDGYTSRVSGHPATISAPCSRARRPPGRTAGARSPPRSSPTRCTAASATSWTSRRSTIPRSIASRAAPPPPISSACRPGAWRRR
jgi:hypothetical protein